MVIERAYVSQDVNTGDSTAAARCTNWRVCFYVMEDLFGLEPATS